MGKLIKHFFSAMIFILVLLGLIDFSDIMMLRSGPQRGADTSALFVQGCVATGLEN